jgi:gluconate 5-dehydrogenase
MSTTLFDLTGRTALITGSSRGLGRAMAEGLGRAGARLLINGTNAETVDKAVEEMRASGLDAMPLVFNVSDEAGVKAAFASLDAQGIAVDILVNNAGIQFRKPMVELETSDWQRILDVNLTSAFVIGREAARRMIAQGRGGSIINITSGAAFRSSPRAAHYVSSKAGLVGLTRASAMALASHCARALSPSLATAWQ